MGYKIVDVNVKSTFLLMKKSSVLKCSKFLPSITISSNVAYHRYSKNLGIYSISKTALLSLTKITAMKLALDGIRVNFAPGILKTKFSKEVFCHFLNRSVVLSIDLL